MVSLTSMCIPIASKANNNTAVINYIDQIDHANYPIIGKKFIKSTSYAYRTHDIPFSTIIKISKTYPNIPVFKIYDNKDENINHRLTVSTNTNSVLINSTTIAEDNTSIKTLFPSVDNDDLLAGSINYYVGLHDIYVSSEYVDNQYGRQATQSEYESFIGRSIPVESKSYAQTFAYNYIVRGVFDINLPFLSSLRRLYDEIFIVRGEETIQAKPHIYFELTNNKMANIDFLNSLDELFFTDFTHEQYQLSFYFYDNISYTTIESVNQFLKSMYDSWDPKIQFYYMFLFTLLLLILILLEIGFFGTYFKESVTNVKEMKAYTLFFLFVSLTFSLLLPLFLSPLTIIGQYFVPLTTKSNILTMIAVQSLNCGAILSTQSILHRKFKTNE